MKHFCMRRRKSVNGKVSVHYIVQPQSWGIDKNICNWRILKIQARQSILCLQSSFNDLCIFVCATEENDALNHSQRSLLAKEKHDQIVSCHESWCKQYLRRGLTGSAKIASSEMAKVEDKPLNGASLKRRLGVRSRVLKRRW